MVGEGREKIGTLDVHVARSARMNKTASLGEMANLIGGKPPERTPAIPNLSEDSETKMEDFSRKMASRPEPDLKEVGSVMRMPMMDLTGTKISRPSGTVNGAATDKGPTVNGPVVPSLNRSLNGWIAMKETSHDERIPKRILSVGRSG